MDDESIDKKKVWRREKNWGVGEGKVLEKGRRSRQRTVSLKARKILCQETRKYSFVKRRRALLINVPGFGSGGFGREEEKCGGLHR